MKVDNDQFVNSKKGITLEKHFMEKNFYQLFDDFTNSIDLTCDAKLTSFNGLYGYTTYDSVQYFENIQLTVKEAPSKIPLMQYSFYRFIIAINHFNDEMTLIENVEEGTE